MKNTRIFQIKYTGFIFLIFLCSCGTIFQGYYYETKIDVPERTKIYDSSNFEIPYFLKPVYKTEDTAKYIELRTSDDQHLTFVLDSHYKKIIATPKVNYLTLLSDTYMSIACYGVPLIIDFANGNMFKFDDIKLTKEDFSLLLNDTMHFIRIGEEKYKNKIIKDSVFEWEQGFIARETFASMFVGIGFSSLGFVLLIPPNGEGGMRFKLSDAFEIGATAEYNFFSEEYVYSDYSGAVFRYALETKYYPKTGFGGYLLGALNYFNTYYEKYYGNPDKNNSNQDLFGLTLGAGFGGKWWFMEAKYSAGFEKIKLWDSNSFALHYYSFAFFFNLPI